MCLSNSARAATQGLLKLPPLFWGSYNYCEAAFYHKQSEVVLVTDAAVYVGESAPDVIPEESLVDLGAEDGFTIRLLRLGNYRGGRNLPGAGGDRDADPAGCAAIGWQRMAGGGSRVHFIHPAHSVRPSISFTPLIRFVRPFTHAIHTPPHIFQALT